MSYSLDKSLGGCIENQQISKSSASPGTETEAETALEAEKYLGRLRPRPTKQTERFKTALPSTSLVSTINHGKNPPASKNLTRKRTSSGQSTAPKAKAVKTNSTDSTAKTGSSSKQSSVKSHKYNAARTGVNKGLKDSSAGSSNTSKSKTARKASKSGSSGSVPKKVFPTKKSQLSKVGIKTAASSGHKKATGKNTTKRSSSKASAKKVEPAEPAKKKAPRHLKKEQNSSPRGRRLYKVNSTSPLSKTGACASGRRGSEWSRQASETTRSSVASSQQSDSGRRAATNNILMRRSRQASGEESRKRAASDREGMSSATRIAGEVSVASGGGPAAASSNNDSESDDPDVSRLQALLEARGLPRIFGSLGPRMQQVLHRSVGAGSNAKVQQFLLGIQAEGDESQQLQSAIGLCQLLVMGNEDTLAGFPVKVAVPPLTNLLKMEHNFDLMNHACRALTYMMEALPHSSAIVTDAIPILLDKLHTIQCIDVAEQSLAALDILSKRHASAVLTAGGVSSCLQYIDFFSLPAQRSALSVAANCCYAVGTLAASNLSQPEEEFGKFMKASLPLLSSRLSHHDQKCVESTCLCFIRLIDSFQQDRKVLSDIAAGDLLRNFQRLLVVVPALLSSGMLVLVIHSVTTLCSKIRELACQLLKDNIAETLHYLLCGRPAGEDNDSMELLPRGSQEMLEITSFIVQLLPRLPKDDPIFVINDVCSNVLRSKTIAWQWRDDSGQWHSYKRHESRLLELAYTRGERDFELHTGDRTTSINFVAMRLLDENTGTSQPVQRILASEIETSDNTSDDIKHDTEEFTSFVEIIFPVLCEVYSSSAGYPPVRHVCLQGMHQMVYFTEPAALEKVLNKISLSSKISSMLSNPDIQIVVGALQLAEIIMRKLPDVFKDPFTREGVIHRVENLSEIQTVAENKETPMEQSSSSSSVRKSTRSQSRFNTGDKKPAPYALRTADEHSSTKIKTKEHRSTTVTNNNNTKASSSRHSRVTKLASSFLSNLSPSSWGRSISSALSSRDACSTSSAIACGTKSGEIQLAAAKNRSDTESKNTAETEKWLKRTAVEFLERHFKVSQNGDGGQPSILDKLTKIALCLGKSPEKADKTLEDLTGILGSVEVSPFELIQSGTISALLSYLTIGKSEETENGASGVNSDQLDKRVRIFLSVHAGLRVGYNDQKITEQTISDVKPFLNIVRKLNQCVGRLEQFPVKNRELISSRSNILRALTTRQLKCQLQQHPDCQNSKRWVGGPIKVDPMLQMRAIERYLVMKGYGASGGGLKPRLASLLYDDDDDDDDSDNEDVQDEIHDIGLDLVGQEQSGSSAATGVTFIADASRVAEDFSNKRKHSNDGSAQRLEFYISNHKIPRHMTIYQALQQYSLSNAEGTQDSDISGSSFTILSNNTFWGKTHLVHYRLEKHDVARDNGGNTQKTGHKISTSRKSREISKNPLWHEGVTPASVNPIHKLLSPGLPSDFTIKDPSTEALCLLRVVHAISRYWYHLYSPNLVHTNRPLVAAGEFVNNEINGKCTHQLEDPLVIITGQLSAWVQQIGQVCPFILTFETRQLLFKVTTFERDRAMQHLLDTGIARSFTTNLGITSSNSHSHSSSPNPFVPRLEKKKCSVSRKNLLQQAEKIFTEHGHSLAMIEVDYQGEVGTGLGPTLEFFTLTSKEIQSSSLKLWREELHGVAHTLFDEKNENDIDSITATASEPFKNVSDSQRQFVSSSAGLFPRPIGYSAKHSQIVKISEKFRFMGKFLAKALLDGRLVDVPLSVVCYRWLLGEELSFTGLDLVHVDPGLSSTFRKFCLIAHEREQVMSLNPESIDSLEMDGCLIEDLGLDMCLPGYSNIELQKMGKNTAVTARNLDKYLNLLVHWTLFEGVKHQMVALKEGFESVIPSSSLWYFYPEELDQLFCGSRYRPWEIQELSEACHPDHGYTQDSETVKALYRILSSYDSTEQRNFLQFLTGCPHLPFGGLRSLNPPLTVVRKTCEGSENPDNYLPSVMTCLNYLKLPEYTSEEVMRKKLEIALSDGQRSFLLS